MTALRRVALAGGLALVGVAVALVITRPAPAHRHAVATENVGTVPSTTGHSTAPHNDGAAIPAGARLVLGRLGVSAVITHVSLDGNVMQIPRDPRLVGWWTGGAKPGADHGTVVIVGHINYAGVDGALSVLPHARPGDVVSLRSGTADRRYRIVAVHTYPKTTGLPSDVFDAAGSPRLVLITCGGPFDTSTGNYEDNIVGYAVPA